jgi:threonine aldolase
VTPADRALRQNARNVLTHHRGTKPSASLAEMAQSAYSKLESDVYGEGGAVTSLEERVAKLLGKPRALFFFKGVIAQLCVLRVYADERASTSVALHPLSHIDYDEANAIEHLHNLRPLRLGRSAPFTAQQLGEVSEKLGSVVVELPLRRAGYLLPSWEELVAISAWCRKHGVPLHFDGARLWEAAAGYGRSLVEVAALADSVYVSFYKGLGGLAGCAVAGEPDFIEKLKVWKARHGGNVFTSYPCAVKAHMGLDHYLGKFPHYVERARALAPRIAAISPLRIYPSRPDTNAFHILVPGRPEELAKVHRAFCAETSIWLFNGFTEAPLPMHSIAEVVIGDTCESWTEDEAVGWISSFAERSAPTA